MLSYRLLQFVPVNSQHLIESDLRDPIGTLSLDEYVAKLRSLAALIHPKIMPINPTPSAVADGGSKREKKPKPPPGGTTSASKGSEPYSKVHSKNVNLGATGQKEVSSMGPRLPPTEGTRDPPRHFSAYNPRRVQAVSLSPPAVRPFVPTVNTGDVSMGGTSVKSGPKPTPPPPPQLGRLQELVEEQEEYHIWARIDSGADAHIAGRDV